MASPGSGRYTNYTPLDVASAAAYAKRYERFNAKAAADKGAFYGLTESSALTYVQKAAEILAAGVGDKQMFPSGVDLKFKNAPDLADTSLKNAGDPANPFMPDVSSPGAVEGAINVDAKSKTGNGKIDVADVKPNYVVAEGVLSQDAQNLGTQSPSNTASKLGESLLPSNLVMGKSKGSDGG